MERHSGPAEQAGAARRNQLDSARRSYEARAWTDAYQAFRRADRDEPLAPEDLERLALAAYLVGQDEDYLGVLERAHNAHRHAGHRLRAVRCAFWLGFRLLMRGESGRASGWFARAQRLFSGEPRACAERGYLLLPVVEQRIDAGDHQAAFAAASDAAAIGEACADQDLVASARHQQGRIRLRQGQVDAGLALLDETMVMVTGGELSPLVTGLMYCSVIAACQEVYALDRAREWTAALTRWCEGQPDMVAFAGTCQVHRAEIMQLRGCWPEAIAEARRACACAQGSNRLAAALAFYRQGELHRLTGEFAAAEEAYRSASGWGLEPQPGLALLRLAQGCPEAAVAAIRRVTATTADPVARMGLLPAFVAIMLAVGDAEAARGACRELEDIAVSLATGAPEALAAEARGAVRLADGDAQGALEPLRRAFAIWQRLEAPYEAARVRVRIGLACRALRDEDGADLEIQAARREFARLGAVPDLVLVDSLRGNAGSAGTGRLTPRELQVLRLIAAGETNKAIASALSRSERTVDRHVSNIFAKLDVPTRAAATAAAYRYKLI